MNTRLRTCFFLLVLTSAAGITRAETATLELVFVDSSTGLPTPARVQVRDAEGQDHVALDALMFGGDCNMSDAGAGFTTLHAALKGFKDRFVNHYSGSTQFYSEGRSTVQVRPGDVQVAAFKGPEYRIARREINLQPSDVKKVEIRLERWIDMPSKGWFSADDHLHIQRPHPDLNPRILKMMQAEDVHVANLLQMGKVRNFEIAPQYAFGPESYYQKGHHILVTGQENPRTHFLGHTITLGSPRPLFDADNYLIYRLIWEASTALGGINGFAHAYTPNGGALSPYDGMAVVLPHDMMHFLEVLQFNRSGYEAWYDILNLGFRVTPTAGTDYPCAEQNIPGHERFYTRVQGELTYEKWLDAVREGRTFVTTGPMAEFRINGRDIGSEILLDGPGQVQVEGRVTFDPERDALRVVELIQNGSLIKRVTVTQGANEVELSETIGIDETSWIALRAYGSERSFAGFVSPLHFASFDPTSNLHTAAVYVTLKGHPPIEASQRSRRIAREWLERLDDLVDVLDPANMQTLGAWLEFPVFDAVPRETLINNREALLSEIATARSFFKKLAR